MELIQQTISALKDFNPDFSFVECEKILKALNYTVITSKWNEKTELRDFFTINNENIVILSFSNSYECVKSNLILHDCWNETLEWSENI